ncbi:MAG: hypothetical protein K2Y28_04395 [Burkholderiaceae bacterium]|nr:hypothetical protein [Burkholderiaceae bacterium]
MRFAGNAEADHVSFPALMTRRFLWLAAISLAHALLFAWLLQGRVAQQTPTQDALTIWAVPVATSLLPEAPKPAPKKSQDDAPRKLANPDLNADAINLPASIESSPNVSPLEAKPEEQAPTDTPTPAPLNLATTGIWKALEKEAPARGKFLPKPAKDSFLTFQKNVAAAGPAVNFDMKTIRLANGTYMTKKTQGRNATCFVTDKSAKAAAKGPGAVEIDCGDY